jgi:phage shock protein C
MERKEMKQGFRKNRRDGMVFGVCAGMADHFGIDVLWTRVGFVALTLLGFGLPLLLYITVAILAP